MDYHVRFCSSQRASRISSEVVVNKLNLSFVAAGPLLLLLSATFAIELNFSTHLSMKSREGAVGTVVESRIVTM